MDLKDFLGIVFGVALVIAIYSLKRIDVTIRIVHDYRTNTNTPATESSPSEPDERPYEKREFLHTRAIKPWKDRRARGKQASPSENL